MVDPKTVRGTLGDDDYATNEYCAVECDVGAALADLKLAHLKKLERDSRPDRRLREALERIQAAATDAIEALDEL